VVRVNSKSVVLFAVAHPGDPDRCVPSERRLRRDARAELAADYEAGVDMPQLMVTYQISKGSVRKALKDASVVRRRHPMSDESIEVARQLYTQGTTLREIGACSGSEKTTVREAVVRAWGRYAPASRRSP
jgi:hypothetical protein